MLNFQMKIISQGPDEHNYCFHNLRKEQHCLDRLHSRVRSVIIRIAIIYYETDELQILTAHMNKSEPLTDFSQHENWFGDLFYHFQCSKAPTPTVCIAKNSIQCQNVKVVDRTQYSANWNIMENVRSSLDQRIYLWVSKAILH